MKEFMKKSAAMAAAFILTAALLCGCAPAKAGEAVPARDAGYSETQTQERTASETTAGKKADKQKSDGKEKTKGAPRESRTESLEETGEKKSAQELTVEEDGWYTSKEEVALYLHTYDRLPDNYITKKEAQKLGWDSSGGNLDDVAPGMSIGGAKFGNYEGVLPDKKGRTWHECDINYTEGYRGAERIVYSSDGLVYYTDDHYKTFEQLY